ncbi:hypothetical protein IC006_2139 [Sulfuracidifex tepidarius]|uniref:Uncharacterized protein n=1 Tax=Sulfuracidifex tepidarius TaxID=1294262 RepID=A0A510DX77_9CREN|nr:hypothetical protein IC006_2139 [Sulfuracidifex tepidarius]
MVRDYERVEGLTLSKPRGEKRRGREEYIRKKRISNVSNN